MGKTGLARQISSQRIRLAVQILFFSLITLTSINGYLAEQGVVLPIISQASLHALCPFGGVVTLYSLATTGELVKKVHQSSLVMLGLTIGTAILFGPVFCGWVCPLGSLQEWLGKLGKKIFKKRYNQFLPPAIEKILPYFRYAVLAWVIFVTAKSGALLFANIDPYFALFHFWRGEVAVQALVVLGITLAGSLLVERPWCRFACPLGGLLGIFNLFRIFRIRRDPAKCVNCHRCNKACLMKINLESKTVIRDLSCNVCLKCTSDGGACPVPDTLSLRR